MASSTMYEITGFEIQTKDIDTVKYDLINTCGCVYLILGV